jgi:hypothetical protein
LVASATAIVVPSVGIWGPRTNHLALEEVSHSRVVRRA